MSDTPLTDAFENSCATIVALRYKKSKGEKANMMEVEFVLALEHARQMERAHRPEERRTGHKALRVKDGQLETFDPNPPADVKAAAVAWERSCQVQPVLPPSAYEGFLAGAAWASSPPAA